MAVVSGGKSVVSSNRRTLPSTDSMVYCWNFHASPTCLLVATMHEPVPPLTLVREPPFSQAGRAAAFHFPLVSGTLSFRKPAYQSAPTTPANLPSLYAAQSAAE